MSKLRTNQEAFTISSKLQQLQGKNPISFEISRITKKYKELSKEISEKQESIFRKYLLVDENGEFCLKPETLEKIEKVKEVNEKLSESGRSIEFRLMTSDYILSEESSSKDFEKEVKELNSTPITIVATAIDVKTKQVNTDNGIKALIDVLSYHFSSDDILFLEELGLLTNLD